jgi:hypothetical protein
MVAPLTPKPTRKAEALTKAPPTIASRREYDFFNFFPVFFSFYLFEMDMSCVHV